MTSLGCLERDETSVAPYPEEPLKYPPARQALHLNLTYLHVRWEPLILGPTSSTYSQVTTPILTIPHYNWLHPILTVIWLLLKIGFLFPFFLFFEITHNWIGNQKKYHINH